MKFQENIIVMTYSVVFSSVTAFSLSESDEEPSPAEVSETSEVSKASEASEASKVSSSFNKDNFIFCNDQSPVNKLGTTLINHLGFLEKEEST